MNSLLIWSAGLALAGHFCQGAHEVPKLTTMIIQQHAKTLLEPLDAISLHFLSGADEIEYMLATMLDVHLKMVKMSTQNVNYLGHALLHKLFALFVENPDSFGNGHFVRFLQQPLLGVTPSASLVSGSKTLNQCLQSWRATRYTDKSTLDYFCQTILATFAEKTIGPVLICQHLTTMALHADVTLQRILLYALMSQPQPGDNLPALLIAVLASCNEPMVFAKLWGDPSSLPSTVGVTFLQQLDQHVLALTELGLHKGNVAGLADIANRLLFTNAHIILSNSLMRQSLEAEYQKVKDPKASAILSLVLHPICCGSWTFTVQRARHWVKNPPIFLLKEILVQGRAVKPANYLQAWATDQILNVPPVLAKTVFDAVHLPNPMENVQKDAQSKKAEELQGELEANFGISAREPFQTVELGNSFDDAVAANSNLLPSIDVLLTPTTSCSSLKPSTPCPWINWPASNEPRRQLMTFEGSQDQRNRSYLLVPREQKDVKGAEKYMGEMESKIMVELKVAEKVTEEMVHHAPAHLCIMYVDPQTHKPVIKHSFAWVGRQTPAPMVPAPALGAGAVPVPGNSYRVATVSLPSFLTSKETAPSTMYGLEHRCIVLVGLSSAVEESLANSPEQTYRILAMSDEDLTEWCFSLRNPTNQIEVTCLVIRPGFAVDMSYGHELVTITAPKVPTTTQSTTITAANQANNPGQGLMGPQ